MLRVLVYLSLASPAVAQPAPPAQPSAPAPQAHLASNARTGAPVVEAPVVEAPVVEESTMKKVCHLEDVAGSAFPRRVCKMKPIKPKDAM